MNHLQALRFRAFGLTSELFALVLGGVMLTAASGALAVQTWDFNALCTSSNGQVTNNCGISTTTDFALAGMSTGTGTQGSPTTSSSTFYQAPVYDWGSYGLGVVNVNEVANATGPHAMDNISGVDAMLFSFGSKVSLTGLAIGWNGTDNATGSYTDSDVSVFAWVGSGTPVTSGAVSTGTAQMNDGGNASGILKMGAQDASGNATTSGWVLVGNFGSVGSNAGNAQTMVATNAGGSMLYSSYWLVSSYATSYGATSNGKAVDAGNDAFKLLVLQADKCKTTIASGSNKCSEVPEPNSFGLLALAGLALWATRRELSKRLQFVNAAAAAPVRSAA